MGAAVLEVTEETVRASGGTGRRPARTLVEAALDWIDDPVGLYDERPVAVADLWRSLVTTLLGTRCESVSVVHPPDWSRSRVDRVLAAVNSVSDHIAVISAELWKDTDVLALQDLRPARRRGLGRMVLPAAVVLLSAGGVAWGWPTSTSQSAETTVVEGRMAVRVPAGWAVQRVTDGPGSRRLQATSPNDRGIALHLTWSYTPATTLADAAEVLMRAIRAEPPGVFDGLDAEASVAGRTAVTYRENRPGRVIAWNIVLDGATRIGIGCQSPPGREADVRAACLEAVRSAHQK